MILPISANTSRSSDSRAKSARSWALYTAPAICMLICSAIDRSLAVYAFSSQVARCNTPTDRLSCMRGVHMNDRNPVSNVLT